MKHTPVRLRSKFSVLVGNKHSQAAEMVLPPGESEGGPDNRHRGADQWLFVVEGRGTATINGHRYSLQPHTLLLIERGDTHQIKNTSRTAPLKTINLYIPPAYTSDGEELPAGKK
jgi:mannose-6-phosphate isomerase-like protein (cupin superfamily)